MGVKKIPFIDETRIGLTHDEFWDPSSGAGHPYLREDWKTQDRLLGALGLHWWYGLMPNEAAAGNIEPDWKWGGAGASGGLINMETGGYERVYGGLGVMGARAPMAFILEYLQDQGPGLENRLVLKYMDGVDRPSTWRRRYQIGTTSYNWSQDSNFEDLLEQDVDGDPYFQKYIKDGFAAGDLVGNDAVIGIIQPTPRAAAIAAGLDPDTAPSGFTDNTFQLDAPDPSASPTPWSSFNIDINSVYNAYNRTLEETFRQTGLTEESLPNYYMMHYRPPSDFTNVQAIPDVYKNQINLSPHTPSTWAGGPITEGGEGSYFEQYAGDLREILDDANMFTQVNEYMQRYKTIAIRPSSVPGIEDIITDNNLRHLPCYVEINFTEPTDTDGNATAPSDYAEYLMRNDLYDTVISYNLEIFLGAEHLTGVPHVRDLAYGSADGNLQMIKSQIDGAAVLSAFDWLAASIPPRLWSESFPNRDFIEDVQCYLWAEDLKNIPSAAGASPKGTFLIAPEYFEQSTTSGVRAADIPPRSNTETAVTNATDASGIPQPPANLAWTLKRSYEELLKGVGSYTETILYKIEKRRVVDADGTLGPVVQTFYIPRVPDRNGFRYIDSQIFYGIQYQYDISPINLVVGSRYSYDDIRLQIGGGTAGLPGPGHALGNALGFYQETGQTYDDAFISLHQTNINQPWQYLNDNEDTALSPEPLLPHTQMLGGGSGNMQWIFPTADLTGHFVFKLPDAIASQVNQLVENVPVANLPGTYGGGGSLELHSQIQALASLRTAWSSGVSSPWQYIEFPNSNMTDSMQQVLLGGLYINLLSGNGITNNAQGGAIADHVDILEQYVNPPSSSQVPGGLGWALDITEYEGIPFYDASYENLQDLPNGAPCTHGISACADINPTQYVEGQTFTVPLTNLPAGVISVQKFIDIINLALTTSTSQATGRGYSARASIDRVYPNLGQVDISMTISCDHGDVLEGNTVLQGNAQGAAQVFQIRFHSGPTTAPTGIAWSTEQIGADLKLGFDQPSPQILELPSYYTALATVQDMPPVKPSAEFIPFRNVPDKILLLIRGQTGAFWDIPIIIEEEDLAKFANIYTSQGISIARPIDREALKYVEFRSDDPIADYQIFRTTEAPDLYSDFAGKMLVSTADLSDGRLPMPSYMDAISPNTKYYYCFRTIDIHGNISNPSDVYQIEMVNNNGQIYPIIEIYRKCAQERRNYIKAGRRFVYIAPSLRQTILNQDAATNNSISGTDWSTLADGQAPPNNLLGALDVDKVWDNIFKVRITSKKTGRKVDLNLIFKNTGVTEP